MEPGCWKVRVFGLKILKEVKQTSLVKTLGFLAHHGHALLFSNNHGFMILLDKNQANHVFSMVEPKEGKREVNDGDDPKMTR